VGPRGGLGAVEKNKKPCTARNRTQAAQPVATPKSPRNVLPVAATFSKTVYGKTVQNGSRPKV
jgi:hypothetical protein